MERINLLVLLLLIGLMSFVSSAPPVTTVDQFPDGYLITEAQHSYLVAGQDYKYHFFVSNSSDGVELSYPDINCSFFLQDIYGNILISGMAEDLGEYWEYNISGTILTNNSRFAYGVKCNDGFGGALAGTFETTIDGFERVSEDASTQNNVNILILMTILFFVLIIGLIIGVIFSRGSYAVYVFVSLLYILSNVFFLILWKLCDNFTEVIPFFETLFELLWKVSNIGYFIIFPVLFFMMLMKKFNETNDNKLRQMGYDDDQIKFVNKRRNRK